MLFPRFPYLNELLPEFIVPEKFLDEEDPAKDEECQLAAEDNEAVLPQGHDGIGPGPAVKVVTST